MINVTNNPERCNGSFFFIEELGSYKEDQNTHLILFRNDNYHLHLSKNCDGFSIRIQILTHHIGWFKIARYPKNTLEIKSSNLIDFPHLFAFV